MNDFFKFFYVDGKCMEFYYEFPDNTFDVSSQRALWNRSHLSAILIYVSDQEQGNDTAGEPQASKDLR